MNFSVTREAALSHELSTNSRNNYLATVTMTALQLDEHETYRSRNAIHQIKWEEFQLKSKAKQIIIDVFVRGCYELNIRDTCCKRHFSHSLLFLSLIRFRLIIFYYLYIYIKFKFKIYYSFKLSKLHYKKYIYIKNVNTF